MVMDENAELRGNRLGLLAELRRELFDQAPTDKEVIAETAVTPAA